MCIMKHYLIGIVLVSNILMGSSAFASENLIDNPKLVDTILVRPGKVFTVTLPENGTTGYSWKIVISADGKNVQQISDRFIAPNTVVPGAGGSHQWKFRAKKRGKTSITFWSAQWWEPTAPITMRRVDVTVDRLMY